MFYIKFFMYRFINFVLLDFIDLILWLEKKKLKFKKLRAKKEKKKIVFVFESDILLFNVDVSVFKDYGYGSIFKVKCFIFFS